MSLGFIFGLDAERQFITHLKYAPLEYSSDKSMNIINHSFLTKKDSTWWIAVYKTRVVGVKLVSKGVVLKDSELKEVDLVSKS